MKNFLRASFFLFVAALVAHADPVHLGTSNKYSVGNKDVPAKVYALFLQEKADGEKYSAFCTSKYYESSFMKAESGTFDSFWNNNKDCIAQIVVSFGKSYDYYSYNVIPGHEDDIIDALASQEVQKEFNRWYAAWLNNPSWSEVCDYINDKLQAHFDSSYEERADAIVKKYPNAFSVPQYHLAYSSGGFGKTNSYNVFFATNPTGKTFSNYDSLQFISGTIFDLLDTAFINPIYNGINGSQLWSFDPGHIDFNFSTYFFTMNFIGAQYRLFNSNPSGWYTGDYPVISFAATPTASASAEMPPVVATAIPEYSWHRDAMSDSFFANVKMTQAPLDAATASAK